MVICGAPDLERAFALESTRRAAPARFACQRLQIPDPRCRSGHFPGSTSDLDAVYFHVGTLVLAGWLKPADPLPPDPHFLGWGHLMPVPKR
jgi:hypothetical protein